MPNLSFIHTRLVCLALFSVALAGRAEDSPEAITSTAFTNTRAEVDQMALLWETDSTAISGERR